MTLRITERSFWMHSCEDYFIAGWSRSRDDPHGYTLTAFYTLAIRIGHPQSASNKLGRCGNLFLIRSVPGEFIERWSTRYGQAFPRNEHVHPPHRHRGWCGNDRERRND